MFIDKSYGPFIYLIIKHCNQINDYFICNTEVGVDLGEEWKKFLFGRRDRRHWRADAGLPETLIKLSVPRCKNKGEAKKLGNEGGMVPKRKTA